MLTRLKKFDKSSFGQDCAQRQNLSLSCPSSVPQLQKLQWSKMNTGRNMTVNTVRTREGGMVERTTRGMQADMFMERLDRDSPASERALSRELTAEQCLLHPIQV